MFSLHVTLSDARRRLGNIVDRFGADHTPQQPGQTGCTYAVVRNGVLTPICIVGQFVADLGLLGILAKDVPSGAGLDHCLSQYGACNTEMWDDLARVGVTFDDDAKAFLASAQTAQDNDVRWGRALDFAADYHVARAACRAANEVGLPDTNVAWPDTADYLPVGHQTDDDEDFGYLPEDEPEGDGLAEWEKELLAGN